MTQALDSSTITSEVAVTRALSTTSTNVTVSVKLYFAI